MGEYYFELKTSQEGVKTLVVYSLSNIGFMNTVPRVVKVITGDEAERLYEALTRK